MVRLKHANDEKSTTGGREFHTFITLSAKKLLHLLTYLLTYLPNYTHRCKRYTY